MLVVGEREVSSVRGVILALRPSIAVACGQHVEPLDDLTDIGLQGWRAALASYVVEMVVIGSRSPILRWARRELKNEPKRWHDAATLLSALASAIKWGTWSESSALDHVWAANLAAHRNRMHDGKALLTDSDRAEVALLYDELDPSALETCAELDRLMRLPSLARVRRAAPTIACDAHLKMLGEIWDQ